MTNELLDLGNGVWISPQTITAILWTPDDHGDMRIFHRAAGDGYSAVSPPRLNAVAEALHLTRPQSES